jgi:hypothetical protein
VCSGQKQIMVESSWNVMAHCDSREGKWRGNWWMEWIASTLHTATEHGVSSITTTDAHASVATSRLNWCPRRFEWSCPFRRKMKSGFCAYAITFQTQSTTVLLFKTLWLKSSLVYKETSIVVLPAYGAQAPKCIGDMHQMYVYNRFCAFS